MQQQLRTDLTDNPPLPGSVTPRRGDLVASLFVDDLWYRAKIEKVESPSKIFVLYIDYGNVSFSSTTVDSVELCI